MQHETKKQWVKPELKVISFAKTNETVLVMSLQQDIEPDKSVLPPTTKD